MRHKGAQLLCQGASALQGEYPLPSCLDLQSVRKTVFDFEKIADLTSETLSLKSYPSEIAGAFWTSLTSEKSDLERNLGNSKWRWRSSGIVKPQGLRGVFGSRALQLEVIGRSFLEIYILNLLTKPR